MNAPRRIEGAAPGPQASGKIFEWVSDLLKSEGSAAVRGPLGEALAGLKPHFKYGMLFSAIVSVLYLSSSIYMMLVYDKVLHSGSLVTLSVVTLALMAALATLAWLDMTRGRLLIRAGLRMEKRLAGAIVDSLFSGGPERAGRSNQLLRDLDQFRATITGSAATALMDAPWVPINLIILFMLHWSLVLLAVTGGVLFLIVARWSEHRMREPTKRMNDVSMAVSGALEAALRHAGPIRALGMTEGLKAMWVTRRAHAQEVGAAAAYDATVATGLLKFLRLLWQSLALGVGALLVIQGQLNPGAMIACSILVGRVLSPLEQIVSAWRPFVTAADNYARLKAALSEAPPNYAKRIRLPKAKGALEAERVTVLGTDMRPILNQVSFKIEPGETVGVVGPSGAGKSTLVRALFGLAPLAQGIVRIDGADINHWRPDDLAAASGYLPQEVALLPGTVRDNISRFETQRSNPSEDIDAAVIEASMKAGVHEMILKLPQGYDTPIEFGGVTLSGGQRQRIGLARAIYRNPALIVLDEPNSNLDTAGELALLDAMRALKEQGSTIIVVTHRPQLLASADSMISLMDGRVHLAGPREQVMRQLMPPAAARPQAVEPARASGGAAV